MGAAVGLGLRGAGGAKDPRGNRASSASVGGGSGGGAAIEGPAPRARGGPPDAGGGYVLRRRASLRARGAAHAPQAKNARARDFLGGWDFGARRGRRVCPDHSGASRGGAGRAPASRGK